MSNSIHGPALIKVGPPIVFGDMVEFYGVFVRGHLLVDASTHLPVQFPTYAEAERAFLSRREVA